ncbi:hypothetical protein Cgig2_008646 [Carnegiea gigantea]|uniref:Zinc knuckle CX2CX4HX4C domain-containing protein n=1 Tax=Carnegiea gigantea TaxID=171969 RepID=A0A9Q1JI01_9CARY|nr:hypothetical protein Cgig2_008646 [Carnegiea gigantea]
MEDSYPVTVSLLFYTVAWRLSFLGCTGIMAIDLEHDLNKLKLTEDEEEILDLEDPGKLLTDNQFNAEALKTTMKNVWRPVRGQLKGNEQPSEVDFSFVQFWVKRGLCINVEGKPKWIELRYVKLPDYCYAHGPIGHICRGCDCYEEGIPKSELPYGPKLRGSPIKRKRKGMEEDWSEEKKKLLEPRKRGSGSRVTPKQRLDDSSRA